MSFYIMWLSNKNHTCIFVFLSLSVCMEIVEIVVLQKKKLKSYVQEMILLNNLLQTGKNYNQMDSDTPQKDKRFFSVQN